MTIHYRKQGRSFIVCGNTFPHKEAIKAIGGRFQGAEKNWRVPATESNLAALAKLCERVGGGALDQATEVAPAPNPVATAPGVVESAPGVSVSELLDDIATTIHARYTQPVWVLGELQNVAKRQSGTFFELAEGNTTGHSGATLTAKAILWRNTESFLRDKHGDKVSEILAEGLQVRVLCRVSFYRDRGQGSLVIEDVDMTYTKGAPCLREHDGRGPASSRLPACKSLTLSVASNVPNRV